MASSRTSYALQFSVEELLCRANEPCGFYLITIPHVMEWSEVSRRHTLLLDRMRSDAWKRKLPRFAGVRVFEEGGQTHRPHAHWVMTPRMSQDVVQHYATMVGLGHVWLDCRIATPYLGAYLAKYLSKGKGIKGVRRWACFGEMNGVKVKDVEIDTPAARAFREGMALAHEKQMEGASAYTFAARYANMAKFGLPVDRVQFPIPQQ